MGRPGTRKLRIGVVAENALNSGGAFQQSFSTVRSVVESSVAEDFDVVVLTGSASVRDGFAARGIPVRLLRYPGIHRLLDELSMNVVVEAGLRVLRSRGLRRVGRYLDHLLDQNEIDIVLFTGPSGYALRVRNRPYIFTVWDLSHRDGYEFPELRHDREYERREAVLHGALTKASTVIVSGDHDARQVVSQYHVRPERVVTLPFFPALAVRRHAAGQGATTADAVRRKYDLPDTFVFYPAQFWPHKNHVYLLEGLAALERNFDIEVGAVFCGSDRGNSEFVFDRARELGLAGRIRSLGFVADEEIPALYEASLALVMPTYLGPTNLPPLEALLLNCPVVYSDLPAFREEMGDAVRYCDLDDPEDLAGHLVALVKSAESGEPVEPTNHLVGPDLHRRYEAKLTAALASYDHLRRRWS